LEVVGVSTTFHLELWGFRPCFLVIMNDRHIWIEIADRISQAIGEQFEIIDRQSVNGGCINHTYLISNNRQDRYFIKLNQSSLAEMFVAEAKGLLEMASTQTISVPIPICWGTVAEHSYLVLENLDLTNRSNSQSWTEMGRNLAAMHRHQISNSPKFGWHLNNTIGSTPQINIWETHWVTFFKNQRIGYQLQLAQRKGGNFPKAAALLASIPQILATHQPQPSLVHGDLWSGNAGFITAGSKSQSTAPVPVIFDPATYWGDREVDVAMTELFGSFPAAFYQGYESVYPLDAGYSQRKILYNLYHILNHYNLFGGSYQSQANQTIDLLLR
jgi:fructosamine-3-kinase